MASFVRSDIRVGRLLNKGSAHACFGVDEKKMFVSDNDWMYVRGRDYPLIKFTRKSEG